MPRSEAQKKADKKYSQSDKNQYTTIATRLHNDQMQVIQRAAEKNNLTKSKFLLLSALYCIDNNIKLSDNQCIN